MTLLARAVGGPAEAREAWATVGPNKDGARGADGTPGLTGRRAARACHGFPPAGVSQNAVSVASYRVRVKAVWPSTKPSTLQWAVGAEERLQRRPAGSVERLVGAQKISGGGSRRDLVSAR